MNFQTRNTIADGEHWLQEQIQKREEELENLPLTIPTKNQKEYQLTECNDDQKNIIIYIMSKLKRWLKFQNRKKYQRIT